MPKRKEGRFQAALYLYYLKGVGLIPCLTDSPPRRM